MQRFLYLYRGGVRHEEDLSPGEIQAHLAKWDEWVAELEGRGIFRRGEALAAQGRVLGAQGVIADGPYAETKEVVGGYSIVSASSIEEASELARGCPIFEFDGTVEVRPFVGGCMDDVT